MPTVLLTRPVQDAAPVVAALRDVGIETVLSPMLDIRFEPGPVLDLSGVQGVLLTSANGARALARRTELQDIPAYAVGDATAAAASAAGFAPVHSATGDVDALADLVIDRCRPGDGPLLHAAGSVTAGDLAGRLSAAGFEVRREKLYSAMAAETLSADAAAAMAGGRIDGVLIYSPRTAKTIDAVLTSSDMISAAHRMTLFALSQNVCDATQLPWACRIVADRPEQQSLLDAVRSCYNK